jgi:hypothetical protein
MEGIIIQIQASITSEAIDNLGEYEEMQCVEKEIEYSFPSNQAIGMANTKSPPLQISKTRSIKGIGENVSQLSVCVNVFHHNVSFINMASQEVMSHFDVFCSPMKNWVLG